MFRHIPTRRKLRSFLRFVTLIVLGIALFFSETTLAQEFSLAQRSSDSQTAFLTAPPTERFPRRIANPVRRDLAQRLNMERDQLSVASTSLETWADGCLELNMPGELCIQMPMEGWRVEVSNGERSWFYRTSLDGKKIRLESEIGTIKLPPQVGDRILSISAEQLGIPVSKLSIAQAQQHWESCLSLSIDCSDVPGWRVIVVEDLAAVDNCWVYRANDDASKVQLDEVVSQNTSLVPTFLPTEQNVTLTEPVVFRAIATGGFTHQTYETLLRSDGQVWRSLIKPSASLNQTQHLRVPVQQVQAFQQLLQDQQFSHFNGLNYSTHDAASVTVTLIGKAGITQYTSVLEDHLPTALLQIIQAWDELVE